MSKMRSVVVGAVLLIGSTAGAVAADLWVPAGGSLKDGYGTPVDPSVAISEGASWYIRGDVGYTYMSDTDIRAIDHYIPGLEHNMFNSSIEDTWSFGGGIGYYFSSHLRGDITIDWNQKAGVKGSVRDSHAYFDDDSDFGNGVGQRTYGDDLDGDGVTNAIVNYGIYYENANGAQKTHIVGDYTFDIQTTTYLANLYYDFSGRGGFRPYVGIGLGFARHELSAGTVIHPFVDNCGCPGRISSKDETNFAYEIMAGFSHEIRQGLKLDVGYRFMDLGKVQTGVTTLADQTLVDDNWTGDIETHAEIERLYHHQIRVGLRYDIW